MIPLHPQFIADEKGNEESVVLPLSEWSSILEELEELDDIRSYDAAKAGPQDSLPFDQAVREIADDYHA